MRNTLINYGSASLLDHGLGYQQVLIDSIVYFLYERSSLFDFSLLYLRALNRPSLILETPSAL